MQPIAADDVAAALAQVATQEPLNGMFDLAGPEAIRIDEMIKRFLSAKGDHRQVVADAEAGYYGTKINDRSITPGDNPQLGSTRFDDWLSLNVRETVHAK